MVVTQQEKTGAFQVLVGKIDDVLQYAIGDPMRYLANWGRLSLSGRSTLRLRAAPSRLGQPPGPGST